MTQPGAFLVLLLVLSFHSVAEGFTVELTRSLRRRDTLASRKQQLRSLYTSELRGVRDILGETFSSKEKVQNVSLCVIGGGVSGLAACITAAKNNGEHNVLLLEASPTFGGRVQSDVTDSGYMLDRGFAVFLEQYPASQMLLDYNDLQLHRFLPGALIVDPNTTRDMHCVADPLRVPSKLWSTLTTPIATIQDKIRLLPLLWNVVTNPIERLFEQDETDTLTCLQQRYGFSSTIILQFLQPFLEGIFLSPLDQQCSRMFHFVLKMFATGSASLPAQGMGAVSQQLVGKAQNAGVNLRVNSTVTDIFKQDGGGFTIKCKDNDKSVPDIHAKSVVLATEGPIAQQLLKGLLPDLQDDPQPQRSVGCLYYSFMGEAPVQDPILILAGGKNRGSLEEEPINNVCFPSVVSKSYAPDGYSLCSVAVLETAMELYNDRKEELDIQIRKQLASWFPDYTDDIEKKWKLEGVYNIKNAQPGQVPGVPFGAAVFGGRECTRYKQFQLPDGLFCCGDYMATASLNGALESGVNAGNAVTRFLLSERA